MNETVSVVIAARKGECFIAEELRSLFLQSRPPDEILLADDDPAGTTAAEAEKLRGELPPGTRLRTSVNPRRLGVNGNMRQLALRASGDFIFFCDQDDVWLPGKIARAVAAFREHPEIMLVHSLSEEFSADGTSRIDRRLFRAVRRTSREGLFAAYLSERIVASGHDMAIRREFLKSVPEFFPPWLYDGLLAKTAAALNAALPIDEVLCRHRLHAANAANGELLDNSSIRGRLSRLRVSGRDEIKEQLRGVRRFEKSVAELPLPPRNREFLERYVRYLKRRVALRRRNGAARCFPGCGLMTDYFTMGSGVRSWLRDALFDR